MIFSFWTFNIGFSCEILDFKDINNNILWLGH